jgi:ectoine hydroxylase
MICVLLSAEQVAAYRNEGFVVVDSVFAAEEIKILIEALEQDCLTPGEHLVTEASDDEVRAVYASHTRRREYATLIRLPRLLAPVRQLLDQEVYLYQFKINSKPAFVGSQWAWHQDFAAWRIADNLPAPRLVNVALFLDDVTEFNGPIIFVPGSHAHGLIRRDRATHDASAQHLDPEDISLSPPQLAHLVRSRGMVSPKGPAGSVVFFDPEIVHGSAPNMSPFPRRVAIATYNDVTNPPQPLGEPRPAHVVCPDTTELPIVDEPIAPIA